LRTRLFSDFILKKRKRAVQSKIRDTIIRSVAALQPISFGIYFATGQFE
jgi:hypothetical protein